MEVRGNLKIFFQHYQDHEPSSRHFFLRLARATGWTDHETLIKYQVVRTFEPPPVIQNREHRNTSTIKAQVGAHPRRYSIEAVVQFREQIGFVTILGGKSYERKCFIIEICGQTRPSSGHPGRCAKVHACHGVRPGRRSQPLRLFMMMCVATKVKLELSQDTFYPPA